MLVFWEIQEKDKQSRVFVTLRRGVISRDEWVRLLLKREETLAEILRFVR